ncbi:MAG: BREX-6 system BrxE protein [Deltaproteobacteria bacterium CG_4_9_14_3_um_filter_63_12]|nr:MAG: BREX-6 system BrxE protein [Deltaproteobacteria bacterium CG_4_9_14_3_um_filter_63_12]
MFEVESPSASPDLSPIPMSELDAALTAQLVVAWAGEGGEEKRLGWWRCDLVSEFGGQDLFQRLLPSTWTWAVLQGAREAARRTDAELRRQDHDPDAILSLFSLGFELDERLEERLQDLKRSGRDPSSALPGLSAIVPSWNRAHFFEWVQGHGDADSSATPIGRRLAGDPPSTLGRQVQHLVAALAPAADHYPMPHYRKKQ